MHASPASTRKLICVKTLLSPPVSHTPVIARQQRHRHDQDDAERQRPALVLRREHARRRAARTAGRSGTSCCRRAAPDRRARSTRTSCRWAACCSSTLGDRGLRLPGAVARRRAAVDLGRRDSRCSASPGRARSSGFTVHHRAERHHLAARRCASSAGAICSGCSRNARFRLHVDLIGAAEPVEVVGVERARGTPAACRRRRSAGRRRSSPARDRRRASICGTLTWKLENRPASDGICPALRQRALQLRVQLLEPEAGAILDVQLEAADRARGPAPAAAGRSRRTLPGCRRSAALRSCTIAVG